MTQLALGWFFNHVVVNHFGDRRQGGFLQGLMGKGGKRN